MAVTLTPRQRELVSMFYVEATRYGAENIDACTDALIRAVVAWDERRELCRLIRTACYRATVDRHRSPRVCVSIETDPVAPAARNFDAVAFIERHLSRAEREALAPRDGEARSSTKFRRDAIIAKLLEVLDA